jgi:hypothetical protein
MPRLSDTHNLQMVNPDLAKEWHPTKNGTLTPGDVTPGSTLKVWWKCDDGHEWDAIVSGRASGRGCRMCYLCRVSKTNNLQAANPEAAKQWHPTLNGDLTPSDVAPNSHIEAWWLCDKGHVQKARVQTRNEGRGCFVCHHGPSSREESLQALYPEIADQWHPTKNGDRTPSDVTAHSGRRVWWQCERDHEWDAVIAQRTIGKGCPFCSGRRLTPETCLQAVFPELAKEWHPTLNGDLTPRDVSPKSAKKVWWLCPEGHVHDAIINNRSRGIGCRYCAGRYKNQPPEGSDNGRETEQG